MFRGGFLLGYVEFVKGEVGCDGIGLWSRENRGAGWGIVEGGILLEVLVCLLVEGGSGD